MRTNKKSGWRESGPQELTLLSSCRPSWLPTMQVLVLCPQEVVEMESIGLRETHVGSELYHFLLEGLTKNFQNLHLGEICNI